jgi:hypothetical protein
LISTRHIAAVTVAVAALLCISAPAVAQSNQSVGSDGSVTLINQHLATLVAGEQPPGRHGGVLRAGNPGARFAAVTQSRPIHLAPILLQLAGRYNRAERLLHFQSNGFDANFWGLVGRGRVRLHYSVKF